MEDLGCLETQAQLHSLSFSGYVSPSDEQMETQAMGNTQRQGKQKWG